MSRIELTKEELKLLPFARAYRDAVAKRTEADNAHMEYAKGKDYFSLTPEEKAEQRRLGGISLDARGAQTKANDALTKKMSRTGIFTTLRQKEARQKEARQKLLDYLAQVEAEGEVLPEPVSPEEIKASLPEDVEILTAYKCAECEVISEDTAGEPLYECGNDGEIFSRSNSNDGDSNRCPSCNKFASKLADDCCADCNAGEVEEVEVVRCPDCDELVELEEYAEHRESEATA